MKKPYSILAEIYDERMLERKLGPPYDIWIKNIEKIVKKRGIKPKYILDICCGTGNTTIPWAKKGYIAIGIDISKEMLNQAKKKAKKMRLDVKFYCKDVTKFKINEKVDVVTCMYDAINHILTKKGVESTFRNVYKTLRKNGLFFFDVNTDYKLKWLDGKTKLDEFENFIMISQPTYNKKTKIANFREVYFIKRGKKGKLYEKAEENIKEKWYSIKELEGMLKRTGFSDIKTYDFDLKEHEKRLKKVNPKSKRVLFVARKV